MTRWQLFQERWRGCTACALSQGRQRVVLARGRLPCDILFIGEAPGISEDSLGVPFVGPAGQLLDDIVARGVPEHLHVAFTNLVCCIPLGEGGNKVEEPGDEAITACTIRLQEFVDEIAMPQLLVAVGTPAQSWLDKGYRHSIRFERGIPMVHIVHPSWILRSNIATREINIRRCVITLQNACWEHFGKNSEKHIDREYGVH